jgi:Flp pilus assembly protein TadB
MPIPIDWATIARYVPEVLLVIIFMSYTYLRDSVTSKERSLQGEAAASERNKREIAVSEERKERDASWQQFLKEERDARTLWSSTAGSQWNQLAVLVTATNTLIIQHDTWERAFREAEKN